MRLRYMAAAVLLIAAVIATGCYGISQATDAPDGAPWPGDADVNAANSEQVPEATFEPSHGPSHGPAHGPESDPATEPALDSATEPALDPSHGRESDPALDPSHGPESEPSPAPTPGPEPGSAIYSARLAFVGDLMAHDVQKRYAYNPNDDTYSFISCYELIKPYLNDADYTVGNLETPVAGKNATPMTGYNDWPLFNAPVEFAEALKETGFDLVTTANNHANDMGEAGILHTLEVLDSIGLDHAGTNATIEDQEMVLIKEINNIRFAFLAYTSGLNSIPLPQGKRYLVNRINDDLIRRQIEYARQEGAEIIIVMPHMGEEFQGNPDEFAITRAHDMCRLGADIVMASHPHVLQPTEIFEIKNEDGSVRTCFIAYSMGNFISGLDWKPCDAGAVFYLDFEKTEDEHGGGARLVHASYAPTWVQLKDKDGNTKISIHPVSDTLSAIESGQDVDLSERDIARLKGVHRETTKRMSGDEAPDIRPVYTLYRF